MIAKFANVFHDHEKYSNKDYLLNKVTSRLLRQVANIFLKGLRTKVQTYGGKGRLDLNASLKELCNIICQSVDLEKTNSWDWYFLLEDYQAAFQRFLVKPFPVFMDATGKVALEFLEGDELVIKELNEAFSDNNIGYRLQNNPASPWVCLDPSVKQLVATPEAEARETAWQSEREALEQIKRVRERLWQGGNEKKENEKEVKEALQDCIVALDAFLKETTGTEKTEDALATLQKNNNWGPKWLLEDGLLAGELLRKAAGNEQLTDRKLTFEQAVYLVDRVLAFANYLRAVGQNSKDPT